MDVFVTCDQSVCLGEKVVRSYSPARRHQKRIVLNVYCCETDHVQVGCIPSLLSLVPCVAFYLTIRAQPTDLYLEPIRNTYHVLISFVFVLLFMRKFLGLFVPHYSHH